jgi:hypothetical protein
MWERGTGGEGVQRIPTPKPTLPSKGSVRLAAGFGGMAPENFRLPAGFEGPQAPPPRRGSGETRNSVTHLPSIRKEIINLFLRRGRRHQAEHRPLPRATRLHRRIEGLVVGPGADDHRHRYSVAQHQRLLLAIE